MSIYIYIYICKTSPMCVCTTAVRMCWYHGISFLRFRFVPWQNRRASPCNFKTIGKPTSITKGLSEFGKTAKNHKFMVYIGTWKAWIQKSQDLSES